MMDRHARPQNAYAPCASLLGAPPMPPSKLWQRPIHSGKPVRKVSEPVTFVGESGGSESGRLRRDIIVMAQ